MALKLAARLALAGALAFAVPAFADAPDNVLSEKTLQTAVRDLNGLPIGAEAYETWGDAVRAGDMAAFVELIRTGETNETLSAPLRALALAADRVAGADISGARGEITLAREDNPDNQFLDYIDAWLLAMEGKGDEAVELHRASVAGFPGLAGDLSLAALLEGLDRTDEALAVYASLTPGEITAPKHDFDPNGIVFNHIQTVVARRALLLRRLDRIEEAKAVYKRLADAEPEQAVRYAAAIEALEDGDGLDDEMLTPRTAFARSVFDLSLATYQQKIIRASFAGRRITGFDETKSALDQIALLLAPENEDYRSIVVSGLHREALFDGASHVALSAPEDTADLLMSASLALLLKQDQKGARLALDRAIKLGRDDAENELAIIGRAARIYMLLDDQEMTLDLTTRGLAIADNPAESAAANTNAAAVLQHFGRHEDALVFAQEAKRLDDTHDRRVFLANVLGEIGDLDAALKILRRERLDRPNDPYTLNTLGYFLLVHTDRYQEAYKLLIRARSLARHDPYIADSLGWAFYKLGHNEQALGLIEQSKAELLPHFHWEIEDHLGDLLWLKGERDKAETSWKIALDNYPPADVKARLQAKLAGREEPEVFEKQDIPTLGDEDRGEIDSREI